MQQPLFNHHIIYNDELTTCIVEQFSVADVVFTALIHLRETGMLRANLGIACKTKLPRSATRLIPEGRYCIGFHMS